MNSYIVLYRWEDINPDYPAAAHYYADNAEHAIDQFKEECPWEVEGIFPDIIAVLPSGLRMD